MKCPTCGTPNSEVLDVRQVGEHTIRRRLCFNNHRYRTAEIPEAKLRGRPDQVVSEKLHHRNLMIIRALRNGQMVKDVADRHGLTIQMIPRILRAMGADDLIRRRT